MAEYKAILEKGRQNNRKRSEKMRELRMSDPEYRAKMEEKVAKAPVKMLVPTAVLILPAMLIVVMAPVFLGFVQ